MGDLHWGQTETDWVVRKSCALLMFLRDLDVFFLGTAMLSLLFPVERIVRHHGMCYLDALKSLSALNLKLNWLAEQEQVS